jgi:hypothetical protein
MCFLAILHQPHFLVLDVKNEWKESLAGIARRSTFSLVPWSNVADLLKSIAPPKAVKINC